MRAFQLLLSPLPCLSLLLALIFPSTSQNYDEFRKKHIDSRTNKKHNNQYCNTIMEQKINRDTGTCRKVNTFIHAPEKVVVILCRRIPNAMKTSTKKFSLTICKLQRKRGQRCTYKAKNEFRRIEIKCEDSLPVHFCGDVPPVKDKHWRERGGGWELLSVSDQIKCE
ncbi:sialic acid-binding lectin-like [Microcaecilia unicolor]|uniref:Sialic acid-binding lectin-like n=1 Tax=Microcaecilia unicolor TaxID=1415580 RepID=A0A6P7WGY5_9AMPH|nr:sialic acid-binding lectin-like [Microcaecilia unicolor]